MASNKDFYLELNFAGNNNASGSMIDDKSKQWFGASVHSSGQDGIIVVRINSFTSNFNQSSNQVPKVKPASSATFQSQSKV